MSSIWLAALKATSQLASLTGDAAYLEFFPEQQRGLLSLHEGKLAVSQLHLPKEAQLSSAQVYLNGALALINPLRLLAGPTLEFHR
ncbi:MAG TPA: hypothetical protein VFN35_28360 [Ktedonobacteraceae bacterium]|nr:hypothetical protein [Ktedonobacteraceae bacterium]